MEARANLGKAYALQLAQMTARSLFFCSSAISESKHGLYKPIAAFVSADRGLKLLIELHVRADLHMFLDVDSITRWMQRMYQMVFTP